MKVRMFKDGEAPGVGKWKADDVLDLDPDIGRLFIKRGLGELSSVAEGYVPKPNKKKKNKEEVVDNGGE